MGYRLPYLHLTFTHFEGKILINSQFELRVSLKWWELALKCIRTTFIDIDFPLLNATIADVLLCDHYLYSRTFVQVFWFRPTLNVNISKIGQTLLLPSNIRLHMSYGLPYLHLKLTHFEGHIKIIGQFELRISRKRWEIALKCNRTTFINIDYPHGMQPFRMFYFVTLTSIQGHLFDCCENRKRWQTGKSYYCHQI